MVPSTAVAASDLDNIRVAVAECRVGQGIVCWVDLAKSLPGLQVSAAFGKRPLLCGKEEGI